MFGQAGGRVGNQCSCNDGTSERTVSSDNVQAECLRCESYCASTTHWIEEYETAPVCLRDQLVQQRKYERRESPFTAEVRGERLEDAGRDSHPSQCARSGDPEQWDIFNIHSNVHP